jgi:hypothetical protein
MDLDDACESKIARHAFLGGRISGGWARRCREFECALVTPRDCVGYAAAAALMLLRAPGLALGRATALTQVL